MPRKPKSICTHVGRQVARINVNDLRSAEPLELVGLAVVCHNLAVMTVKERNCRLPEADRVDVAEIVLTPSAIRGGKGKPSGPVH
jgi:hypothetical protein